MSERVYNFGAGPATLPQAVIETVENELLNWHGMGLSVMELGHRTPEFMALMTETEQALRALLTIPDTYHVLFLGGAARTQFAMVPMNFLSKEQVGAYLVSGVWSSMAYEEAQKIAQAVCIASSKEAGFHCLPEFSEAQIPDNARYLYYTSNETVNGVQFKTPPYKGTVPLVSDMTSSLLSEPLDVSDFGLIFAGAQKNFSIAGLTVVIVDDAMLKNSPSEVIPTMFDYRTHVTHHSLYATPPTFNCYIALTMFKWIKAQGGVEALYDLNQRKSSKLYQFIDHSNFYQCNVEPNARSILNVCFSLTNPELEPLFLQEALCSGLYALKGHRLVGGLRASLYNAMPMSGVDALLNFMDDFARKHR